MSKKLNGTPMRELPKYKSHKIVHALKILNIDLDLATGAAVITPAEEVYGPFPVDAEYMGKHKPRIGGYYVVYEDGYKSWSPAEAFESGYAKIEGDSYSPLSELKAALQRDEDYAWTWHCNIACIALDCGESHEDANRRAASFMKNAFDVDVTNQDNWKQLEDQWKSDLPKIVREKEKFLEVLESGDPLKDFYDEDDLASAVEYFLNKL